MRLDALEVVEGPADVFVRLFQGGAVLVNGGPTPVTIDLASVAPGMSLRRLAGTQDPTVNTGQPVSGPISLPAHDAPILTSP